jgi:hypothetical protein
LCGDKNEKFYLGSFQMATGSIEYEGPGLGVGDFVLLSEITMDAFVENLKLRFDIIIYETL